MKQRMRSAWQLWRGQARTAKLCLALAALSVAAALLLSSGTLCYAVSSQDLVREQAITPAAQPTRQLTGAESPGIQTTAAEPTEPAETPPEPAPTEPQEDTPPADALIWPVTGRITSPFGPRTIFGGEDFHRGLDIAVPLGRPSRRRPGDKSSGPAKKAPMATSSRSTTATAASLITPTARSFRRRWGTGWRRGRPLPWSVQRAAPPAPTAILRSFGRGNGWTLRTVYLDKISFLWRNRQKGGALQVVSRENAQ